MINQIINGNCLEVMKDIETASVDMILCDLPYGTTACKWDTVIPFEPLWEQYKRIIKSNGAIVLTASQPFTTDLINSNRKWFKYEWIWDKVQPTGAFTVKTLPMKQHENILVFYQSQPTYNRQMSERNKKDLRINAVQNKLNQKTNYGYEHIGGSQLVYSKDYDYTKVNPKTILSYSKQPIRIKNEHPTQKPVALFEYLIKTYTNENDLVLDNCSGSGTTAIACIKTNRNYICIEKDKIYFDKSVERVNKELETIKIF